MLKAYLQKEGREMLQAALVGIVVFAIYSAFIYFVGMPMTIAKNDANRASLLFKLQPGF